MLRRLLLACVLLFSVAACQGDRPPTAAPVNELWSTVPADDAQRWELLAGVRNLDPCALLTRESSAGLGYLLRNGRVSLDTCEFILNSAKRSEGLRLYLTAYAGPLHPLPNEEGTRTRKSDGITYVELVDTAASPELPVDQLVERNCTINAIFPSTAVLQLAVSASGRADPCPFGQYALGETVREMRTARVDVPPVRAVPTVLDGADPCAVLGSLAVTAAAEGQRPQRCRFAYRGDDIEVRYGAEDEQWARRGSPRFEVAGRAVYPDSAPDDEFVLATAVMGDALDPFAESTTLGPKVPVVQVSGTDTGAVDEVIRRVLELLPPP